MNEWIKKHGISVRSATEAERVHAHEAYGILDCRYVAHDDSGVFGYGDSLRSACEHYCDVSGERHWNCPQQDFGEC